MSLAIDADDVRAAAERIRPLARRTPVMTSAGFDAAAGARVFFKCENLQRGGAFKIRGASNLILSLPKDALERGVVAYSSGNHAQATAIAARHADCHRLRQGCLSDEICLAGSGQQRDLACGESGKRKQQGNHAAHRNARQTLDGSISDRVVRRLYRVCFIIPLCVRARL